MGLGPPGSFVASKIPIFHTWALAMTEIFANIKLVTKPSVYFIFAIILQYIPKQYRCKYGAISDDNWQLV
jgi:hypothetical protein